MNSTFATGTGSSKEGCPVLLTTCDLWTLQTALTEYKDKLLLDVEREPACPTYRQHLREAVNLLDYLKQL